MLRLRRPRMAIIRDSHRKHSMPGRFCEHIAAAADRPGGLWQPTLASHRRVRAALPNRCRGWPGLPCGCSVVFLGFLVAFLCVCCTCLCRHVYLGVMFEFMAAKLAMIHRHKFYNTSLLHQRNFEDKKTHTNIDTHNRHQTRIPQAQRHTATTAHELATRFVFVIIVELTRISLFSLVGRAPAQ